MAKRSTKVATLVRKYRAGYRHKPEGRREIQAAQATAVRLLSSESLPPPSR